MSAVIRGMLKFVYGNMSVLVITRASEPWKMAGYFTALSSPFGTLEDDDPQMLAQVEAGRADEVAHVLDHQQIDVAQDRVAATAEAIMVASRWQAPSVLICTTGTPRASIRSASIEPAMSPSMTAGRSRPRETSEKGLQERGLAAAGRADDVDAEHAGGVEAPAVLGGELIVGFEDILGGDDFHGSCQLSVVRCRH